MQPLDAERRRLQARTRLLAKYGLTLDDYARLLEAQRGACAVCEQAPKPGKSLAVDHDHAMVTCVPKAKRTPELVRASVRGLLCWLCNHRRLGRGATARIMRRAAEYLETPPARPFLLVGQDTDPLRHLSVCPRAPALYSA